MESAIQIEEYPRVDSWRKPVQQPLSSLDPKNFFRETPAPSYGFIEGAVIAGHGIEVSGNIVSFSMNVPQEFYEAAISIFPKPEEALEAKFERLSEQWKQSIGRDSSITNITSNIYYRRIIGLGSAVVPLILRDLQKAPAPWFDALRALTEDTDSVGREFAGNFRKIAECWIKWGRQNGLI